MSRKERSLWAMPRGTESEEFQKFRVWNYCDESCILGKAALTTIRKSRWEVREDW